MSMLAHSLDSYRTKDVILDENVTFELLLLNTCVLNGLAKSGFKKPSPIQVKAIPVGRCGFDLIVKSKSGTGKTLVYAIVALETVETSKNETQVLILVPTREIVVQIEEVLLSIGRYIENLQIKCFIGGFPLDLDKEKCNVCHIAIGTPGRVKRLINDGILKTGSVRLFVLDEVDKLMENSFQNDVNEIYNNLSGRTQIITTSATYTDELKTFLQKYMLSPTYIGVQNDTPFLWGLKQFVRVVKQHTNVAQQMKIKTEEVLKIFSNISFTQCVIFTNYQIRAESISNTLNQKGWASTYVSAARPQSERIAAVKDLKNFNCKIMLSTDLTARGIDAANIDLVINYDVPLDATTYLHRMGRAGRYGSSGICINLVSEGVELQQIQGIIDTIEGSSLTIPELPVLNDSQTDLINVNVLAKNYIFEANENSEKHQIHNSDVKLTQGALTNVQHKLKKQNKEQVNQVNSINPTDNNSKIECDISDILNKTKKESELIKKQLGNEDTNTLLKSLASGDFLDSNFNDNGSDNDVICPELQQLILFNKSEPSEVPHDNELKPVISEFNHNKTIQEFDAKAITYHKNKALLCVSSLILNKESIDTVQNNVEDIQTYLNILKEEESKERQDILSSQCESETDILRNIDQQKPLDEVNPETNNCLENIFKLGYDFATKPNAKHWRSYFPDSQNIQKSTLKEPIGNTDDHGIREEIILDNPVVSEEDKVETIMKWIPVEPLKNTHKKLNVLSEEEIDKVENIMKWIPVEPLKKVNILSEEEVDKEENMKWVPVEPLEKTNVLDLCADENDSERYYKYFENYSEDLWLNGLGFETVNDFDNWFYYEWQMNVAAVRGYIQQNIYHQEMKKFQESKTNV